MFIQSINYEQPQQNNDDKITHNVINIYHILKIIVDILAKKNHINEYFMTSFIISQAELKHIAKVYNTDILNDWRYNLIGKPIQDFLDGKLNIAMLNKDAILV